MNEKHWSAKPSAQQCMWLYLLPCLCRVCSKVSDSLMLALRILSCSFLRTVCSKVSDSCYVHSVLFLLMQSSLTSFWCSFTGLVQLIFSFPSWFHTIWLYCSHAFHSFLSQNIVGFSFGLKDMITAFTCLPLYRYSSCTLRPYLCWRHTYCQWPIFKLTKNVFPNNKWPLALWSRFIYIRMCVFRRGKNCWLIM